MVVPYSICDHFKELSYVYGDDGMHILSNLLREILSSTGFNSRNFRHVKIQIPLSVYISGFPIASLQDIVKKITTFLSRRIPSDFRNVLSRKDGFTDQSQRDRIH